MGSGSYSSAAYNVESKSRGFSHKSTDELFINTKGATINSTAESLNIHARVNNTNIKEEMLNVGVRESRDTEEHPHTTPILIALDVTGSMRRTPEKMIKDQFPKLMEKLVQGGIEDPQLLFMAIGDHVYDSYPLQISQFESATDKILDSLQDFYLEGGAGGNLGESYLLAWIAAGFHTETDSFYKRGRKGYLFTLGDEPCLNEVPGRELKRFLGYQGNPEPITAEEALQKAQEQYNVFHIHITDANHSFSSIENKWKDLVGQNLLKCESSEVAEMIAETIRKNYIAEESITEEVNSNDNDIDEVEISKSNTLPSSVSPFTIESTDDVDDF